MQDDFCIISGFSAGQAHAVIRTVISLGTCASLLSAKLMQKRWMPTGTSRLFLESWSQSVYVRDSTAQIDDAHTQFAKPHTRLRGRLVHCCVGRFGFELLPDRWQGRSHRVAQLLWDISSVSNAAAVPVTVKACIASSPSSRRLSSFPEASRNAC